MWIYFLSSLPEKCYHSCMLLHSEYQYTAIMLLSYSIDLEVEFQFQMCLRSKSEFIYFSIFHHFLQDLFGVPSYVLACILWKLILLCMFLICNDFHIFNYVFLFLLFFFGLFKSYFFREKKKKKHISSQKDPNSTPYTSRHFKEFNILSVLISSQRDLLNFF